MSQITLPNDRVFFQSLSFGLHFIAEIQFLALIVLIYHLHTWQREHYQRIEGNTDEEPRNIMSIPTTALLMVAVS